jgi:WD40 repeat protein
VATGTERHVLTGHTNFVNALAFSPDGSWLATASMDRTVRIWHVATGTERHMLTGHAGNVLALAVVPDGTSVATGIDDGTVRIWDTATGAAVAALRIAGDVSNVAAFDSHLVNRPSVWSGRGLLNTIRPSGAHSGTGRPMGG